MASCACLKAQSHFDSIFFYLDKHNEIQINSVQKEITKFSPLSSSFNIEVPKNTVSWIVLKPSKNKKNDQYIFIEQRNKKATLFYYSDSLSVDSMMAGMSVPFHKWFVKSTSIAFPLLNSDLNKYYYLKIESGNYNSVNIVSLEHFNLYNQSANSHLYMGIFIGILIIAGLYSLSFYFLNKEKAYIYYSLYILSFLLFAMVDWGIILRFVTYFNLPWHRDFFTIPFVGITVFLLFYVKYFLQPLDKFKWISSALRFSIILRLLIYLYGTLFDRIDLYNPYIDNALLFPAYLASIMAFRNGFLPARFVIVGFSILYIGLIVHTLHYIQVMPLNFIRFFSLYNTGIAEVLFFTLALADRFRIIKKEHDIAQLKTLDYLKENNQLKDQIIEQLKETELIKDQTNAQLEIKVRERTLEWEEANRTIHSMNQFLKKENIQLSDDLKDQTKKRVEDKQVSLEEFIKIYPDEAACFNFIEELKWKNGFVCKSCANTKYSLGNKPYSRRCSKCNNIETITANTIFSYIKIPVNKAFYMLFLLSRNQQISADKLSDILLLRRETCWAYKKKIINAIEHTKKSKTHPDGWSFLILEK